MSKLMTAIMVGGMVMTPAAQYLTTSNTYSSTSNQYSYDEYENDILEERQAYKTIQYNNARLGQNVKIRARTLEYVTRYIAEQEYIFRSITVLQLDNTANLDVDYTNFEVEIDTIKPDAVESMTVWANKYPTVDPVVEQFLTGRNYTSPQQMQTLWSELDADAVYYDSFVHINDTNTWRRQIEDYEYISFWVQIVYDGTQINDNGEFLENILTFSEIKEQTYYTPADASGYEIVDIPGLMFQILGMPFAWISTAFNFTIFPNTPYALNISHLLMAIIISFIAIFIIKKLIK